MTADKKSKISTIKDEVNELHPLLNKLLKKFPNVIDVEYTHGATEMGADFVLSIKNPVFDNIEYTAVIAKIGKISQDFSDIERQIEECDVPRTFFAGKEKIKVSEIWIIVTDNITKNAQEKIHHKYISRKITFIDGGRLEKFIDNHMPTFWTNVALETGEYLTNLRQINEHIDKSLSLVQIADKSFYIEQDIYEFPREEYRIKIKKKLKTADKINIIQEIESNQIILVEGGMGSGKSKLLRHLVGYFTDVEIYLRKRILPIMTTYKIFIETYEGSIDKLISSRINDSLRKELTDISYLLLIDGIDEKDIPVDEQVNSIKSLVDDINTNSNVKSIITSRYLKGLERSDVLETGLRRCEMRPLSLARTFEFLKTLCEKLNITGRIFEDLKKSQLFKELPKSPISAILLAKLLNENAKDLPSNMTELYSKYIELMLGRWDIDKGLQTQKEYQSLDNIMTILAKIMMDNELIYISLDEVKGIFKSYLKERNLDIDPEALFSLMLKRCEMITVDITCNTFAFKHKTFAEYFYAKSIIKNDDIHVERAFKIYWMNTFFFYLGIQKDCPKLLESIIGTDPSSEPERWLKIINMGNYYLAAYLTPYDIVINGLVTIMLEAAKLYKDNISKKVDSPFQYLPRMHFLYILQYILRNSYSYKYFKNAIENAALIIDDKPVEKDLKAYAIFFLNVAYIELGGEQSFDILLTSYKGDLPVDLSLALTHESKHLKLRTTLMRKQDKRLSKLLKNNPSLRMLIDDMYSTPIKKLKYNTKIISRP